MKVLQPILVFLSMMLLFPVLFSMAYFLWKVNRVLALAILFIGLCADLLGGFEILNRTLSHI